MDPENLRGGRGVLMKRHVEPSASRRGSNLAAVVLVVLPLIYVLSYAPLNRWMNDRDSFSKFPWLFRSGYFRTTPDPPVPRWELVYLPVKWTTDYTPLREPLFWWADLWDVDFSMRLDHGMRTGRGVVMGDALDFPLAP